MKTRVQKYLPHALIACLGFTFSGATALAATSSDVTLYGLIDVSLSVAKGNVAKRTALLDGTNYGPGSRWGLRVKEDLGSGIKVGAVLESGFSVITGQRFQGGRMFGRQSFLSLQSDQFGELRIGRQYMLHDETLAAINAAGSITVISPAGIYTVASGIFNPMLSAPRIDNAAQLTTPRIGGLQAKLMYAFGSGTQDIYRGVKLDYRAGPVQLVLAHERSSALDTTTLPNNNPSVNKITVFGGSYDFNVVKLFAGYERGKDLTTGTGTQLGTLNLPGLSGSANNLKAVTFGAAMPVGDVTYAASFVRSRYGNAAGQGVSVSRYGVSATWQLSKRTSVYSALAFTGGDLKTQVYEKRIAQVGIRHRF